MKSHPCLTYLLLVCLLAACLPPSNAPGGQSTTITFACWDFEREIYEPLVKKFNAQHPEITVQVVSRGSLSGTTMDRAWFSPDGRMPTPFFDSSIVAVEETRSLRYGTDAFRRSDETSTFPFFSAAR
jgi:hypothetical protein